MKKMNLLFGLIVAFGLFLTSAYAEHPGSKKHEHPTGDHKELKKDAKTDPFSVYQCPMKCEGGMVHIREENCSKCGMKTKEIKVNKVYVCPMEEHQDKVFTEPGKCPECGMNLKKMHELPEKAKDHKKKKDNTDKHDHESHEHMDNDM